MVEWSQNDRELGSILFSPGRPTRRIENVQNYRNAFDTEYHIVYLRDGKIGEILAIELYNLSRAHFAPMSLPLRMDRAKIE